MEGKSFENQFKGLSINYVEAPVEIRELLTFDELQTKNLLVHLRDVVGIAEVLILSTCNRTEIYFNHPASTDEVLRTLCAWKGISSTMVESFFNHFQDSEAVAHLFRVAIGLESQILGDMQIINQVKNAYQWTADLNLAGTFLHRLLHSIFFAHKRVGQETQFRSGSASVSYAGAELVDDLLTRKDATISLLGLGEIGLPLLKNLLDKGFSNITVCNRSFDKVAPFEAEYGVRYLPFSEWKAALHANLVISALSGNILQITDNEIAENSWSGYQYLIDLGVPRSIQSELGQKDGIILYNIDQIHAKVSAAVELRRQAVPLVESIVAQAIEEFLHWTKEMAVSPVIHLMKNALEQIRKEEMARFLKKAGEKEAQWAEELTKSMMQRIMKTHIVQLKAACQRDEAEKLSDVLQQLFHPIASEATSS